jgi:flagellin
MRINQNIMAFNAYRNLSGTNVQMGKSLEKLSSGFRINRAADDAAGLVISQGLRAQVSGLRQATRNAQDGISVVQTAEGALDQVHTMLNRMRDLAVQSANGSNDSNARAAANNEIVELRSEISRIGSQTKFGTQSLLNGSYGNQAANIKSVAANAPAAVADSFSAVVVVDAGVAASSVSATIVTTGTFTTTQSYETAINSAIGATGLNGRVTAKVLDWGNGQWSVDLVRSDNSAGQSITVSASTFAALSAGTSASSAVYEGGQFQVGANASETIKVAVAALSAMVRTIDSGDVLSTTNSSTFISRADTAINLVSGLRGSLGAKQNRFESTISNLQVTTENLSASESRIRDTDMALEMVSFTRHQILLQAGTAMLGQANQIPQSVLSLLQ